MDFFGSCMFTKNSLTVQDSVIFFFLVWCCSCSKSIILFLWGNTGTVKIRLVLIDWRQEATCQLSLLLHAVTLHCDLRLFLHLVLLERCQSRCQSRCWSILILTTWLTTWLMTCPHQELEAASLHFFVVPSTDLLYLWDLMLGSHVGFARTSQECYLSSTSIAMDSSGLACNDAMPYLWESARVQPMLFPAYKWCYHQLLPVTLPCAISQLSHGCCCNLVREWRVILLTSTGSERFPIWESSRTEAGELHVYRSTYLWDWILDSQEGIPWRLL